MTEPTRRLKVFLCHAHSDAPAVYDLFRYLRHEGVDVWLDKESLLPGADWNLEIRKAVRESDAVVVCLSKQFNREGYRQREVKLALDTAEEKLEGQIFIIPARLEVCDVPDRLRQWHWVDLFEESGRRKLIEALRTRAKSVGAALRRRSGRRSGKSAPQNKEGDDGDLPSWMARASAGSYVIDTRGGGSAEQQSLPDDQVSTGKRPALWMDHQGDVWRKDHKLGRLNDKAARRLLAYLIEEVGRICDYRSLYQAAYNIEPHGYSEADAKAVDELVVTLRQLVEKNPQEPRHILQIGGLGYLYKK